MATVRCNTCDQIVAMNKLLTHKCDEEPKRYVVGFYFRGNEVLLIQKQRPEWQKGFHNGLGGKIEPGETPLDAMVREFKEECGISVSLARWLHFATLNGEGFQVFFFRSSAHPTDAPCDRNLTDEIPRYQPKDNLYQTVPNLLWLVPMAFDMERYRDWPFDIRERAG